MGKKQQKVVKWSKEDETAWLEDWNNAGLKVARAILDEVDSANEALLLLDIAKTMIENALKAKKGK